MRTRKATNDNPQRRPTGGGCRLLPQPIGIGLLLALGCLLAPLQGNAQESEGRANQPKALWEFGLFNVAGRLPYYRGSDQYRWWILPLPYFIYRGQFFKSDREGLRSRFLRREQWEVSLSAFGNPPVRNDGAREGMPSRDPILELGPALKVYFTPRAAVQKVFSQLAVRGVASAGWDDSAQLGYQGWHSSLSLNYINRMLFGHDKWTAGMRAGVDFTDQRYNRYFYDVDEEYARPDRPAYASRGGYYGTTLSIFIGRDLSERLFFGVYSSWTTIAGAAIEDSPLATTRNNYSVGCALAWMLGESKQPQYQQHDD